MLSIGKLGIGQEAYYTEKVAEGAEDYYSGEGEAQGQWMGDAAAELGLHGEVDPAQLTAMLTGRSPLDGSPLLANKGVPAKGSVPGFDLTFSAPKSVSLLWGLGGPAAAHETSAAHHASVEAALRYMQREACWTRRGAGGAEFVPGNGYLAAAYVHRSSRNGDPQLHTHVLIANATQGPDGRWTRLYHPAIYEHAKTASYIYEAHLRHELTLRLGVEWQGVRKGIAEIEGFADAHLREFSTRRAEILEAAGPLSSARARQVANLATRQAKEQGVTRVELHRRWRTRAEEIGLDRETIERTFDPEAALRVHAPAEARTASFEQVGRAVTAGASHFDRREAIQAVAGSLREGASGAEIERMAEEFLASEHVIEVGGGPKGSRYTTVEVWEIEQKALDTAERMRAGGPRPAGERIATQAIEARPTLKSDQREMVARLLVEREGLVVVIGEAGTGKSYAIVAAAEGWAAAGIELRAAAPTWRAANVLRSDGLAATSIASLLVELDRAESDGVEGLASGSVLLIDEAGMVDSATLARLIHHADRADAKLVLVGDPEQLPEIEAGGLFRALADRGEPIHLDQVIRHRHDVDREAAKRIREGQGREAFDLYRSEERVVVAADAQARRETMLGDWHRSFDAGEDAVMIAQRNAEVERLNAMARAMRREAGRLGTEEIEVGEARFAAGDRVITRVNDRSLDIYNRERWQVAEVDAERRRVVLEGIDQARRVEVGAEYLARTNPHSDAPALQHAYAVTTYSAQGSTVERAYVMADPSMDKQELYVAASRSREETWLYATPEIQAAREEIAPGSLYLREGIPHIAEAAERDRGQVAAHDLALRSELRELPTEELVARHSQLDRAARKEAVAHERHKQEARRIEETERNLSDAVKDREAVAALPRKQQRVELPRVVAREEHAREIIERLRSAMRGMAPVTHRARADLAIAERILSDRRQLAIVATRLAPPDYIVKELGERPSDPEKRAAWNRGVAGIESYRQEHGVKDRDSAFGRDPDLSYEREMAQHRLHNTQLQLGRTPTLEQSHDLGHDLGIEL